MRAGWILITVVAGACSKGGASPSIQNGGGGRAATVPCPPAADVEARLRALWSVPAEQKLTAACTAGRFPAPGWAIAAFVDVSDDEAWERSAVIGADGAAIAQGEASDMAPWYRMEQGDPTAYQVTDFDGDGIDELVEESGASHGGSQVEYLTVLRVAGGALRGALSLETHYDNAGAAEEEGDAIECDVDTTFVGQGKAIFIRAVGTFTAASQPAEDCWRGTRTYRLVGDAFVADE